MTIQTIQNFITSDGVTVGSLLLFCIATLIQISPIKVYPWSWVAKKIGRAINGETAKALEDMKYDLSELKQKLCDLKEDVKENEAIRCRQAILRFGDEVLTEKKHTKEHFDEILDTVTKYENYCDTHPNFKNNKTQMTVERIEEVYKECLKNGDFL